jgi:hypothetical protein
MEKPVPGEFSLINVRPPWWVYLAILAFLATAVVLGPGIPKFGEQFTDWAFNRPTSTPENKQTAEKPLHKEAPSQIEKQKPVDPKPSETKTVEKTEQNQDTHSGTKTSSTRIGVLSAGPIQKTEWKHFELTYGDVYNGPNTAVNSLRFARVEFDDSVKEVLKKIPYIPSKKTIRVVRIPISDLGFKRAVLFNEIITRAGDRGLRTFPLEAIPAFAAKHALSGNTYFATQVADENFPWRASLKVSKNLLGAPQMELKSWDGIIKRFDPSPRFAPSALIVFMIPE